MGNDMLTREDLRDAIEQAIELKETNVRQRFRLKRALRNPRVMERMHRQLAPRMESELEALDVDSILDWLMEHFDEILKLLLSLIAIF